MYRSCRFTVLGVTVSVKIYLREHPFNLKGCYGVFRSQNIFCSIFAVENSTTFLSINGTGFLPTSTSISETIQVLIGDAECKIQNATSTIIECTSTSVISGLQQITVRIANKGYAAFNTTSQIYIEVVLKLYRIRPMISGFGGKFVSSFYIYFRLFYLLCGTSINIVFLLKRNNVALKLEFICV